MCRERGPDRNPNTGGRNVDTKPRIVSYTLYPRYAYHYGHGSAEPIAATRRITYDDGSRTTDQLTADAYARLIGYPDASAERDAPRPGSAPTRGRRLVGTADRGA